jgi:hypothetical protein
MRYIMRVLIATVVAVTWLQLANITVAADIVPPTQGREANVANDQNETGYWMTNSSGKRHNKNCRYYKNSRGHICGPKDGIACKICGG